MLAENLTKATQTAGLLANDLLQAHSDASRSGPEINPILAILLRQLLADARSLESRLLEIEACCSGG